jgi:hypothetical protein
VSGDSFTEQAELVVVHPDGMPSEP